MIRGPGSFPPIALGDRALAIAIIKYRAPKYCWLPSNIVPHILSFSLTNQSLRDINIAIVIIGNIVCLPNQGTLIIPRRLRDKSASDGLAALALRPISHRLEISPTAKVVREPAAEARDRSGGQLTRTPRTIMEARAYLGYNGRIGRERRQPLRRFLSRFIRPESALAPVSNVVEIGPEEFAHFEECMNNPQGPTPALLKGMGLLRSLRPKNR
jgi:hypothetical protein